MSTITVHPAAHAARLAGGTFASEPFSRRWNSASIAVSFGGPAMKFRVLESMLQVCVHGTHHRAQVINMLRHSGVAVPAFDLSLWLKEIGQ